MDRAQRQVPAPPAVPRAQEWAHVAPYRDRLVALARGHGLSADDAQDVAHHALCAAVERGVGPERAGAVLVKAVERRSREVLAEAERQERLLARTRADDRLVGGVDEAVCDREHLAWLLGRLPERERRVLVLSSAGTTVTGIAELTGLSYPTVDRLLSRGRKELRRLAASGGLVALAVWRQRRLVAAPATVAVAGVTVLALRAPVPPEALPAVRPPAPVVEAAPARGVPLPRRAADPVVPVVAPRPAAVLAAAVPAPRRPVRRPVAAAGPITISEGDEGVVERVGKCLRNGVAVTLGSRGGVVCEEDR